MAKPLGLTKAIESRLQKAKEKVNPNSETNKNARLERKKQQMEEKQAEREAYYKERRRQIEERGKAKAKHEVGNYSSKKGKSVKGYASYAGSVPMFKAVDPMSALIGPSKKPKPKAVPSKTTRIVTGGKTITIKENVSEEEQKKKKPQNDWPDPFADFY